MWVGGLQVVGKYGVMDWLRFVPFAGRLVRGRRESRRQRYQYALEWSQDNARALEQEGPLWVVLGDSTGQAVGASGRHLGYVGQTLDWLWRNDDPTWRVLNYSVSGATTDDVLAEQLPRLRELRDAPGLVTCLIGANDVRHFGTSQILEKVRVLLAQLPDGAVVGTLPHALHPVRSRRVNSFIRRYAAVRGFFVADVWATTGPPWWGLVSADGFHPNEMGYARWASALMPAVSQALAAGRSRKVDPGRKGGKRGAGGLEPAPSGSGEATA